MNLGRRSFLKALGVALVGAAVPAIPIGDHTPVEWVPGKRKFFDLHVPKPFGLTFHPDAFAFVMEDLRLEEFKRRYLDAAVLHLAQTIDQQAEAMHVIDYGQYRVRDERLGISMRLMNDYEFKPDPNPTRLDWILWPRDMPEAATVKVAS